MRHLIVVIGLFILGFQANGQLYMAQNGEVSFFSKTPLEDIDALNKQVGSIINIANNEVAVQMRVTNFVFPNKLMQEHFNENYMHSDKFPRATFNGSFQKAAPLTWPGSHQVELLGKLEIHGVSKEIRVPATLAVKGEEAQLNLKFSIKLADYGIKNDKTKNISETIEITVKTSMKKS